MRLTRRQIGDVYQAIQNSASSEFALKLDAVGKLRMAEVQTVEKLKPVALTHQKEKVSA